jgi:D-tyrosyl-tRNA(Tyr) deacylase
MSLICFTFLSCSFSFSLSSFAFQTLYGTLSKQNKPDYKRSMKNEPAQRMYSEFLDMIREAYQADRIFDGVFGAMMDVGLVNDGPVTLVIESEPQPPAESEPQPPAE